MQHKTIGKSLQIRKSLLFIKTNFLGLIMMIKFQKDYFEFHLAEGLAKLSKLLQFIGLAGKHE